MPRVELVYDGDCPNVADTRAQLLRAFAEVGVPPRWQEWQRDAADSPAHVRHLGSPTILVDGADVAGAGDAAGACCRLYAQPDGSIRGVPGVEAIARALRAAGGVASAAPPPGASWKLQLAMLPGLGAALLPKVACPACWPAYAGLLGSVGLGFLLDTSYLLPLTALFLAVAVLALAFRAHRRRGYGPFGLGLAASALVLAGKFALESDPTMYAGLLFLVGASVWNGWPRRPSPASSGSCASCTPTTQSTE